MYTDKGQFNNDGFGIIEVIVGLGISSIIAAAFIFLLLEASDASKISTGEMHSLILTNEMAESIKAIEKSDWQDFDEVGCKPPATCYTNLTSEGEWELIPGKEEIKMSDQDFSRSLQIRDVERNQLEFPNYIVKSGGVVDPNTKRVTIRVDWTSRSEARTKILDIYIYNHDKLLAKE